MVLSTSLINWQVLFSKLLFSNLKLDIFQIPDVSLTWQIASQNIRTDFITTGNLANTIDTNFRAINDDWPVSAFALDFGNITQTRTPLVFAMGFGQRSGRHLPDRQPTQEPIMAKEVDQCREYPRLRISVHVDKMIE